MIDALGHAFEVPVFFIALLTTALANPYAGGGNPYQPAASTGPAVQDPSQPFHWEVPEIAMSELTLVLRIPEGHAVYRDQIHIRSTSAAVTLGEPVFPEAKLSVDPSDPEQWRALYEADIQVVVPVSGSGVLALEVEHQGCAKGLCWPSTTSSHTVRVLGGAQPDAAADGGGK